MHPTLLLNRVSGSRYGRRVVHPRLGGGHATPTLVWPDPDLPDAARSGGGRRLAAAAGSSAAAAGFRSSRSAGPSPVAAPGAGLVGASRGVATCLSAPSPALRRLGLSPLPCVFPPRVPLGPLSRCACRAAVVLASSATSCRPLAPSRCSLMSGATVTPGTTSGNPATTASDATTAAVAGAGATTTTIAETATTPSSSSAASGATPTSWPAPRRRPAPASAGTPASGPDAGTTSTFPNGLPAPITPEEIKNCMLSLGMGSADQLQIYDYRNFGHYAAAYVMAADENVYLVLLNDETGGWVIPACARGCVVLLTTSPRWVSWTRSPDNSSGPSSPSWTRITGLDWEAVKAQLRATAGHRRT